jgi:hypothetical protein
MAASRSVAVALLSVKGEPGADAHNGSRFDPDHGHAVAISQHVGSSRATTVPTDRVATRQSSHLIAHGLPTWLRRRHLRHEEQDVSSLDLGTDPGAVPQGQPSLTAVPEALTISMLFPTVS